jgi:hypothetical protein
MEASPKTSCEATTQAQSKQPPEVKNCPKIPDASTKAYQCEQSENKRRIDNGRTRTCAPEGI